MILLSLLLSLLLSFPVLSQAFPSTPVLDSFTRADEDPLSGGGNWSGPFSPSDNQMKLVSNAMKESRALSANYGGSYWALVNFGPGVEVYVLIPTFTGDIGLIFHTANEGTASRRAYDLYIGGGNTWQLYRNDNGVETQLGADLGTQTVSNGDAIGIMGSSAGVMQAYYKASGGSWTTIGSTRTDTTYTSGHIGIYKGFADTTSVMDDFGGGTISAGILQRTLTGAGQ